MSPLLISCGVFLAFVLIAVFLEKRHGRKLKMQKEQFDNDALSVARIAQKRYEKRYGHPAAELEASFPELAPKG